MRKRIGITAFLILLSLLLLIFLYPHYPVLVIMTPDEKRILWSAPTYAGEKFTIRYTHSVAYTDVDEIIRVGKGELIIDASIYESFGAGLASAPEGNQQMEMKDGKVILSNLDIHQPYIQLGIGQVVANHRLIYRGKLIPLKEISPPGSSIRFAIRKENLLKHIGRGFWSEG